MTAPFLPLMVPHLKSMVVNSIIFISHLWSYREGRVLCGRLVFEVLFKTPLNLLTIILNFFNRDLPSRSTAYLWTLGLLFLISRVLDVHEAFMFLVWHMLFVVVDDVFKSWSQVIAILLTLCFQVIFNLAWVLGLASPSSMSFSINTLLRLLQTSMAGCTRLVLMRLMRLLVLSFYYHQLVVRIFRYVFRWVVLAVLVVLKRRLGWRSLEEHIQRLLLGSLERVFSESELLLRTIL